MNLNEIPNFGFVAHAVAYRLRRSGWKILTPLPSITLAEVGMSSILHPLFRIFRRKNIAISEEQDRTIQQIRMPSNHSGAMLQTGIVSCPLNYDYAGRARV